MWAILGQSLAGLGKIDEAIKAFEKSLNFKPNNIQVYCNLASLLTVVGKFEDAETACCSALSIQPNFAKALHSLGAVSYTHLRAHET